MPDRSHYSGSYQRRARAVRTAAYADPSTACWRCGRVLSQHRPGARWHAGHTVDGDSSAALLAEADECNLRFGGELGVRRRGYVPSGRVKRAPVVRLQRSRDWY